MASTAEEEARLMGDDQDQASFDDEYDPSKKSSRSQYRKILLVFIYSGIAFISVLLFAAIFAPLLSSSSSSTHGASCLDLQKGYTCRPGLSQNWGQYSPYYLVPSAIRPTTPPANCRLTSAHLLARHGARDPTYHKSESYANLIAKLQAAVPVASLTGPYTFLAAYNYTLGSDQLTSLGRQQMVDAGRDFFSLYADLVHDSDAEVPFIRASDQRRVVESAEKFAQGFHDARASSSEDSNSHDSSSPPPYPILTIPETPNQNNTLSHDQCPAFNRVREGEIAQRTFASTWLPPIQARLLADLPTSSLTLPETISLMDLCPFDTVASPIGTISPFCTLFTPSEWKQYSYHQTLGKYYGYGAGSALGPTQGVGWVNELIARLTGKAVDDSTNTNRTLDGDRATFPLGRKIYADFSHDNDMMSIFAAMGLYGGMPQLETGRVMGEEEMDGFGAGRMVPFAGRMVVEGMDCEGVGAAVRVIMNGRVLPLEMCGGDKEGKCTLSAFVDGLAFARSGGKWSQCFQDEDTEEGYGHEVLTKR